MTIDAILFQKVNTVSVGQFDLPPMKDNHLLIETMYTFVSSGTETRVLAGHYGADANFPLIPGYACVGRVLEVGRSAAGYSSGDIAAYGACADAECQPAGVKAQWGGQASRHLVPVWMQPIILPQNANPMHCLLGQVAAISLRGATLATPQPGESAIVIGQGVIGAFSAAWLKSMGCDVIVVDVEESRLQRAIQHWAGAAVNARRADAVDRLLRLCAGGADIVVESSGTTAGVELAHKLIKKAPEHFGERLSVGLGRWPRMLYQANYLDKVTLQMDRYFDGEGCITLTPMDRNGEERNRAVHALANGQIDGAAFIDRVASWRDAAAQYDALSNRKGEVFSVVFDWTQK